MAARETKAKVVAMDITKMAFHSAMPSSQIDLKPFCSTQKTKACILAIEF
jgi:hypothetical protein